MPETGTGDESLPQPSAQAVAAEIIERQTILRCILELPNLFAGDAAEPSEDFHVDGEGQKVTGTIAAEYVHSFGMIAEPTGMADTNLIRAADRQTARIITKEDCAFD